ncbi:YfgM family protein [endosymbiont of Ridgeia piscesae]|jgi:predicted negative regulator of RcsB-dependent stress response|uniref:Ancillary SecYEG translocon subunit n=1 Tax=endosymbiont of Ridgeia piscesae TaxID=54398 RepID=A0A0T5YVI6_9GAMM|nr:tetratricopeptide repeat protein [endosymbiont of Ridgeia piscesae]KRT54644.1 putative negative regulator of RcsB-dependent stress response [endosymbiont of Ridgeia piscesae]KRT58489.1 putative negative regulator of RcsB-dependent stress response [endosymbiont of Ridgeia piscesae]
MSGYQTEEEQVEALKKWWKENGTSVIAGIVLGFGAVFGWQAWNGYQDRVGEEASVAFSQMIDAITQGQSESALKQAELLRLEYESSAYAVFAALAQASLKMEQGDSAAARSQLEWAMQHAEEPGLKQLARLRLARILLSEGETEAAASLVKAAPAGGFDSEFAALRGDIARQQGDLQAARQAYQLALAGDVGNGELVQMKLDDLGVATP